MSLVICSNQKDDVNLYDRTSLDQAPYRFRNHLTNPVQLPPNTEVAVQSVKINRDGLIRVDPTDIWFQYFGEATDDGTVSVSKVIDTVSFPIMCSLLDINVEKEPRYVNMSDYVELLTEGMRLGFPHPDADLTDVDNAGADPGTIATTSASAGVFDGIDLKYKMRSDAGIGLIGEPTLATKTNGGTGYDADGEFLDCETTTSGGGTGATLNITTTAAGVIDTVEIGEGGSGYRIGDTLIPDADTVGVGGSGAVIIITAILTEDLGYASDDWSFKSDEFNGAGVDRSMEVSLIDDSQMRVKCLVDNPNDERNENVCWLNRRPLSHQRGLFEVDLSGLFNPGGSNEYSINTGFAIGLARGTNNKLGMVDYCEGGDLSRFQDFYDYVVYGEQLNGVSGEYFLRVGHSSTNPTTLDENKPISMNQVVYYNNGDGSAFGDNTLWQAGDVVQSGTNGYNLSRNWAKFSLLRFELDGEEMIISLVSFEGGADGNVLPDVPVVLASYTDAIDREGTAENYLKASATTTWCMTPKVMIRTKDRFVDIAKYDGREMEHKGTELAVSDPRGNWYARMIQNGSPQYAVDVDTRYNQFMWDEDNDYVQNNMSSTVPRQYEDYRFITLLGDGSPHYKDTSKANMQGRLGHSRAILKSAKELTVKTFESDIATNLMDGSSCFVRLDNFTQTTFNSGTGRPSRILYQVPRFDTSNRDTGTALYYEPHQRTYVKLNNSEPVSLNELHLSLCDSREQLSDRGITGKTVICLHFQQSQTPLLKVSGRMI